jgi:hypothetical protein
MAPLTTPDTLDTLHNDLQTVTHIPNLLTLAEQVGERLRTQIDVVDARNRADSVAFLTTYADGDLATHFPGWALTHVLTNSDHTGLAALGLLAQLDMLVSAPDLTLDLVKRTRDHLRTALLAGVTLD